MKSKKPFKLIYKLFLIVFVNVMIAGVIFFAASYQIAKVFIQQTRPDPALINQAYLLILLISLMVFAVGFSVMVNKKIRQIKDLEEEIEAIAFGRLGQQIEVKGTDELASLTKNVNRMSAQLKEIFEKERAHEQEKQQLLSNLSHDLKTPLTSIKGYLQLMRDFPQEHTTSSLQIIEKKTEQINHLVNQLLMIDELATRKLERVDERINLSLLSQQLFFEHQSLFEVDELQLEATIEDNLFIQAETDQVIRVFQNLFSNALKYAPRHTVVNLQVYPDLDTNTVIWSLRNKTTSQTLKLKERLAERTFRVDKSRGEIPGDGLGLSIVERIMQYHEGRLDIHQEDDETIAFRLVFPLSLD